MRYSRAFIPTLKEVPKDALMPSHQLLLRAGYVRQIGAGIYEQLPLGQRVLHKLCKLVREEMERAGAQEVLLPALLPAEYFAESGRYEGFGDTLFRLRDRRGAALHLGPTHEEIITDLARREVRSYKQLPQLLYQIQSKFRDEPRPRAGLLRCREFLMKDAYSFDADDASARASYDAMREAYHRIFRRLGLRYRVVQADSGAMGGSDSAEFQVLAQTGEDAIVACPGCDYAANVEVAQSAVERAASDAAAPAPLETVDTPGAHSVEDVVAFLGGGLGPRDLLKSLVYAAGDELVLAVVRGDHEVGEIKLARALGVAEVRLATEAEVALATGARVGFAGPVGFAGRILADNAVSGVRNAVTGANADDKHHRNVNLGRDFEAELCDLREARAGDPCPQCGAALEAFRGIEGGHIFVLGTHYSRAMGAAYQDENGAKHPLVMGCYGIGVSRLMAATVEQSHDEHGIVWPIAIAPYHVVICALGSEPAIVEHAERLHEELVAAGVEVLLDDRDERAGVKFKDADLLGIPIRITVARRGLERGFVELKRRDAPRHEECPHELCVAQVLKWTQDGQEEGSTR